MLQGLERLAYNPYPPISMLLGNDGNDLGNQSRKQKESIDRVKRSTGSAPTLNLGGRECNIVRFVSSGRPLGFDSSVRSPFFLKEIPDKQISDRITSKGPEMASGIRDFESETTNSTSMPIDVEFGVS